MIPYHVCIEPANKRMEARLGEIESSASGNGKQIENM